MKMPIRILVIAGCILLAYAIAAKLLHLPAGNFVAKIAAIPLTFALVRWIGAAGEKKNVVSEN